MAWLKLLRNAGSFIGSLVLASDHKRYFVKVMATHDFDTDADNKIHDMYEDKSNE